MQPTGETIVAIATPPGQGGVGIVRLSGGDAARIVQTMTGRSTPLPARTATLARVTGTGLVAEALVTFFPGPRSYTGEDVVELSAHGSPVILAALVDHAASLGARRARRGEFTLRAFLHGKLDLVQAEAARDLVEAVSPAQARAAFDQLDGTLSSAITGIAGDLRELELKLEASMDFPDEGYRFIDGAEVGATLERVHQTLAKLVGTGARGQLVREGARVVIAGTPNAGKSSLFNALAGADRAIVAATPGTTRDLVSARVVLDDHVVELVDTAGIRASDDAVEQEGVRRADRAIAGADVVIVAVDGSRPIAADDRAVAAQMSGRRAVFVTTKADLPACGPALEMSADALSVSARTGSGLRELAARIASLIDGAAPAVDHVLVTNARHREMLASALAHVAHARESFAESGGALPEEFVAADLQQALAALDEVTGRRTADDLLHEIFARFCIGK